MHSGYFIIYGWLWVVVGGCICFYLDFTYRLSLSVTRPFS